MVEAATLRIQGSPDLYSLRKTGAGSSINFITCHDGFTLSDLVSYNSKHNYTNGEGNKDGTDDNNSWNCGVEGPTDDIEINKLRLRQVKNAISILMLSQGVPMIYSGDELGKTQYGNNNAYCQDNYISWIDWSLLEKNAEIFEHFQKMIAFRKKYIQGELDVSWHGVEAWRPDFSYDSRAVAMMIKKEECCVYAAMNMHWEQHHFDLPIIKQDLLWYAVVDTYEDRSEHQEPLKEQIGIEVGPRSVVVLVGK